MGHEARPVMTMNTLTSHTVRAPTASPCLVHTAEGGEWNLTIKMNRE